MIRGILIGGAIAIASLGALFVLPDPGADEARASSEVAEVLRGDGVDLKGVSCMWQGEGMRCWVTLRSGNITTAEVEMHEDGSWNFTEGSRP